MDLRFLDAKHFVQAQRIGPRQAVALCLGGLIGFKGHVKDEERDHPSKCPVDVIGRNDQHDKNHYMGKRLYKLPVIHGPNARDKSKDAGNNRVGRSGNGH